MKDKRQFTLNVLQETFYQLWKSLNLTLMLKISDMIILNVCQIVEFQLNWDGLIVKIKL